MEESLDARWEFSGLVSEILLIQHRGLMQTGTMAITGMREDLPMTSKFQDNHRLDCMQLIFYFRCSDTYHGPAAWSEIETVHVSNYILQRQVSRGLF